jgi:hypothetical protein
MTNSRSLIDGTIVLSDSPEWLAECEARHILSLGSLARETFYSFATKMRGDAAVVELVARVAKIEPHYVLKLASRELRAAYLDRVRASSIERAESLERAVRELWKSQKAEVASA